MEKKFLVFKIGFESFAVELKVAREIIPYSLPKQVPSMPAFFTGVIHLRGFFLPIIDLKKFLQIETKDQGVNEKKKIIILAWQKKIFGIVIDEIEDIYTVEEEKILPPPQLITDMEKHFFKGGFLYNDNITFILNLEGLFKVFLKTKKMEQKELSS